MKEVVAMRVRILVSVLAALGFAAAAVPASAHHDGTLHSPNMRLLSNGPVHGTTVSDVALWGRTAFVGDYLGFTIWDVSDPEAPAQLANVDCNGQQHDVSVWKGLMFLSIDAPITEPPCGPNAQPNAVIVDPPSSAAGRYPASGASFGPQPTDEGVSGDIVQVNDGSASPTDGCQPLIDFPAGAVALIDRGGCAFVVKVSNAQDAGAVAVIVVNNVPGDPTTMGGTDPDITIGSVMVSLADGNTIKAGLPASGTVARNPVGWFEGILIYDVSDPAAPRFLDAVATDCGSHTHTLIPDPGNDRVLLYVSSYPASFFGPTPYGTECQRLDDDGRPLGHSKISVVEVPLDNPEAASVIAEPRLPLSDFDGAPGYRGCHDIGVFTGIDRAAAACLEEGQIWDISDPVNPLVLRRIDEPDVDIYHSGAFSWDGRVAIFGDEFEGGFGAGCRDPSSRVGRAWFHDVATGKTLSSFMIPRAQGSEICTVHNYNVMPVSGRNILVSAWNLGGTSVIDFTDPRNPREIAYVDVQQAFGGRGPWSSYWYNGFIYVSDRGRGLDIKLLSDRLRAQAKRFPYLNAQTQEQAIP
jgi:hypothetical protein